MTEVLMLVAIAVAMRGCGAMVRGDEHHVALRLGGWVVCSIGVWMAISALGGWSPIWPAVLLGLGAGVWSVGLKNHGFLTVLNDGAIVLASGMLSIPPLTTVSLLIGLVGVCALGFALDRLATVVPHRIRLASFVLPTVCALAAVFALDHVLSRNSSDFGAWYRHSLSAVANFGVTRAGAAQRIELAAANGPAVAWLERPRVAGSTAAVVFHGNHQKGSHQPAACILRRALLHAGYVVLSVDHVGYGQTPLPDDLADASAWDPQPIVQSAILRLRSEPGVKDVVAIGHSMGCLDALRAFAGNVDNESSATNALPDAAIVFGMGVYDPPLTDEQWHQRFVSSRRLPSDAIDVDTAGNVRVSFYEMQQQLALMDEQIKPLLFVRFGLEHDDLVVGRTRALELFTEQPEVWDMKEATHYFSATERLGIMFGNVHITRQLADRLRAFRQIHFQNESI